MPSKSTLAIDWPVFRPRYWGIPGKNARHLPRPWYGLDTERDAKTGEFVCGWAVGDETFQFNKLTDIPPGTYFIWNIGYDIEGLLRDLERDEGWLAKKDGVRFELLGEPSVYYHGKSFYWGKRRFLEASSFFGRQPLSKMGAKEHIDPAKMSLAWYKENRYYEREKLVIEGHARRWVPSGEWGYYRDDVDSYCRQDARIVYDNITTLADDLGRMGVALGTTPGATARRFIGKLGQFPPIIWATHKAFLRSYCGGRFEITKRGIVPGAAQYDLVSAYPWALDKCPWLTRGAAQRATRRLSDEALYGTYQVTFRANDYLGIAPVWRDNIRVYSNAETKVWMARPEIEWMHAQGVDYEIVQGLEIFDSQATDAWSAAIRALFKLKQEGQNSVGGGWGAKIILNSQYGVLIQLVRRGGSWVPLGQAQNPVDFVGMWAYEAPPKEFEGGKFFAPVYAGHLTSLVRTRILDASLDAGAAAYCGGHTDSVILTEGKLTKGLGTDLGDWKLEKTAPEANLSKTGMYAIGNQVKLRGITREGSPALLWQDKLPRKQRVGIKTARRWADVSVILPAEVANNYTVEHKRLWNEPLTPAILARHTYIDSAALENVT